MRITDNLLIGLGVGLLLLTRLFLCIQASGLIKDITVTNNLLGANSVKIKIYSARKKILPLTNHAKNIQREVRLQCRITRSRCQTTIARVGLGFPNFKLRRRLEKP